MVLSLGINRLCVCFALSVKASALVDDHDAIKLSNTLVVASLIREQHCLDDLDLDLLLEDLLFNLLHLRKNVLDFSSLEHAILDLASEQDVLLCQLVKLLLEQLQLRLAHGSVLRVRDGLLDFEN